MKRINIGCGRTPTPGWTNYDNSPSVRLSKHTVLQKVLNLLRLLDGPQKDFIEFAKSSTIKWAEATKRIPEDTNSVSVLYSSHMLEHLDTIERTNFLREVFRILCSGGIIRIAVPNIRFHIDNYLNDNDADRFITAISLTKTKPRSLAAKCRFLLSGIRHHHWMYDGDSLCRLLLSAGFKDPQIMPPGSTRIPEPGELNLYERVPESVFVEAVKP